MSRLGTPFSVRATFFCLSVLVLGGSGPVFASPDQFQLRDLDGREHRLVDYRGRWVLVNYWATWCPPCLEELPELEVFHNNAEGRAVVLGVNMENIDEQHLRSFVEQQFLSFPVLPAGSRPSGNGLVGPVDGLPTSYLVTPAGKIVARQVGRVTADGIESFIAQYEETQGGEQ
ncbi:MAG: TlpA family protein disulfide reductase [Gammaproteobacteria bacterium]|nr:TlpA family protein disulfide reductase [Gammaproteobacteria bacterium]